MLVPLLILVVLFCFPLFTELLQISEWFLICDGNEAILGLSFATGRRKGICMGVFVTPFVLFSVLSAQQL